MPTSVTVEPTRNSVAVEPTVNSVRAEAVQVETLWFFLSPWHIVPVQEIRQPREIVPIFLTPWQMVPITEVVQQS